LYPYGRKIYPLKTVEYPAPQKYLYRRKFYPIANEVIIYVLERRYGPRRLRDDDDDDGKPAYLRKLLYRYTRTRTLRSTNQFFLDMPRFFAEFGKRSFSYLAPTVWNGYFLKSDFHPLSTPSNAV